MSKEDCLRVLIAPAELLRCPAAVKDIEFRTIERGFDFHEAKDRVRQIVVRKAVVTVLLQGRHIRIMEGAAEPDHCGHMQLGIGCDGWRQAVQINTLFTERLAMVAEVEECCFEVLVVALEQVDGFAEEIIGIKNGVVVGITYFFIAALAEVVTFAGGAEFLEVRRVAFVIGRAVIAHLVQDDEDVAGRVAVDVILQLDQHAFVATFLVANRIDCGRPHVLVGHPNGDPFRVRIVVQPDDVDAGMGQYVEQVFLARVAVRSCGARR